jgi:hypothetical protein
MKSGEHIAYRPLTPFTLWRMARSLRSLYDTGPLHIFPSRVLEGVCRKSTGDRRLPERLIRVFTLYLKCGNTRLNPIPSPHQGAGLMTLSPSASATSHRFLSAATK